MAQGRKGKLNYRYPRCLMREIDMDMLYDRDKDEYYCLRCSFTGNEQEVLRLNAQFRDKYQNRITRIIDFQHHNDFHRTGCTVTLASC